ncbi:methyltransferase like [Seminavis robusta]|uniref:Methyltransferase like n=1 Tax=Seminavis robusta TaxID=568900 RepID=A0A9N8I0P8_9STRA|nr:methyltransferase like [Seminavis robusta]|eukprot:Sro2816_g337750.1 methyltransferase like (428) ;mRNA; f:4430-5713
MATGTSLELPEDDGDSGPETITLQVPEGAEAGDALSFAVDGVEIEIPVPEGSKPGDVLEIQVGKPSAKACDKQDDDDKISIQVGEKELQFTTVCNTKAKATDDNQNTKGSVDDGTYAHPWPSGMAMAKFLGTEKAKTLFQSLFAAKKDGGNNKKSEGLRVLELGSGLGLGGLSFAAHYTELTKDKSLLLPPLKETILSDVPDGIALLRQNVELNATLLRPHLIEAKPLLWTAEDEQTATQNTSSSGSQQDKFDLLLASDLLYNTDTIPVLVSTIKRHLASSDHSALLIAVRWRKPQLERAFFEALEGWQENHWHFIHTLNCPLGWEDFGDPNCEASNRYFHQTMVAVQGKPHSLAGILASGEEGDAQPLQDQMTDDEADAFENCHIQIYCLSRVGPSTCSPDAEGGGKRSVADSSDGPEDRKRIRSS